MKAFQSVILITAAVFLTLAQVPFNPESRDATAQSVPAKDQPAIDYAARAQGQLEALEKVQEQFKGKLSKTEIVDMFVEKAYLEGIQNHDRHALDFAYIPEKEGRKVYLPGVKLAHLRHNLEQMGYQPPLDMQIENPDFHCQQGYGELRDCKVTFILTGNSTDQKSFTKLFYCEAKFEYTSGSFASTYTTSNEVMGSLYLSGGHGSSQEEITIDPFHCVTGSVTKAKVAKLQCF